MPMEIPDGMPFSIVRRRSSGRRGAPRRPPHSRLVSLHRQHHDVLRAGGGVAFDARTSRTVAPLPSLAKRRMPCRRIACRLAPRTMMGTRTPAAASFAPTMPPMAPAPITAILMLCSRPVGWQPSCGDRADPVHGKPSIVLMPTDKWPYRARLDERPRATATARASLRRRRRPRAARSARSSSQTACVNLGRHRRAAEVARVQRRVRGDLLDRRSITRLRPPSRRDARAASRPTRTCRSDWRGPCP